MGYKKYMTEEEYKEYLNWLNDWADTYNQCNRYLQLVQYLKKIEKKARWIEIQIYYQSEEDDAVYMDTYVLKYAK